MKKLFIVVLILITLVTLQGQAVAWPPDLIPLDPLEKSDSTTLQMKSNYTAFNLDSGQAFTGIAYSIGDFIGASPVSVSYSADDASETIGAGDTDDITSGTVLLTSTTTGDAHATIDIEDGVVDGYCATFVAVAGVDASNHIVLDFDTLSSALGFTTYTLSTTGESVTVCWTGAAWFIKSDKVLD